MKYQNITCILFIFYIVVCLYGRIFIASARDLFGNCTNLFDNNIFLVLHRSKQPTSWFQTKENYSFNDMQDGKWKNHKPCIRKINNELIAMPNIGYRKDEEFEIGCRPKFDLMLWYRGRKSYSVSNRKCKRWDTTVYKNRFAFVFGSPISEAHNFCRNPDSSPCGPWCFLEPDLRSSYKYLREPCFLTCYDEKYLNRPAPCIPNTSWPLSTISAKKHDKRLHSQVLSYSKGNCSMKFATLNELFVIDGYNTFWYPWESENEPYVGRIPSSLWGYGCYSGNAAANDDKFVPTYVQCQDLQLVCIPRSNLTTYNYKGSRNYSLSGKACIPWENIIRNYIPYHKNPPSLTDEFYNAVFHGKPSKFLNDFTFSPVDDNSRCINLWTFLNPTNIEKFKLLRDFQNGPMCFVFSSLGSFTPERCFSACEDFVVDTLNCIPRDRMRKYNYDGYRAYTAKNVTCETWPEEDHNYCRAKREAIQLGPSCYTKDSPNRLQACFEMCVSGKRFDDVRYNYFGYSPCSEKDYEICCQMTDSVFRKKRAIQNKSEKVGDDKLFSVQTESVTIPTDLQKQNGTLSESGLWPSGIGEICLWILFFDLAIYLFVWWKKSTI